MSPRGPMNYSTTAQSESGQSRLSELSGGAMKTNQNFTATELVPAVKVGYEAGTQTPNLAWNQLPQAKVSELIESARHSIQVGTTGDTGFTDSNISAR